MEALTIFFKSYGLPITLIAFVGVVVLGVMKYCNLFTKIEEKYRHYLYIIISVAASVIGTMIYLACVGMFDINYIITIAGAIWALNQTFYNIFKVTSINELCAKVLDWIAALFRKDKTE